MCVVFYFKNVACLREGQGDRRKGKESAEGRARKGVRDKVVRLEFVRRRKRDIKQTLMSPGTLDTWKKP